MCARVLIVHVLLVSRTTRFATFPDYLMVQLSKFTLGDDWVPKKYGEPSHSPSLSLPSLLWLFPCHLASPSPSLPPLFLPFSPLLSHLPPSTYTHTHTDVLIDVPLVLDLSHLRGHGLQEGEVELPEGEAPSNQQQEGIPYLAPHDPPLIT